MRISLYNSSTPSTTIRQLAVPAMNDSAPERTGCSSDCRLLQVSSLASQRWRTASSRQRYGETPDRDEALRTPADRGRSQRLPPHFGLEAPGSSV